MKGRKTMKSPPKPHLINLSIEAMELERALLELGEDSPALKELLERVQSDLTVKVDSYHFIMERLKVSADMMRQKADEFSRAARTLDNTQKRMKEAIKAAMSIMKKSEIRGDHIVFKLTENDPKVEIDPSWLPSEYKREMTTFEIDHDKIKKEIEQGIIIPGVELKPSFTLRTSINKGDKK
jgi:hypothetical protein